MGKHSRGNLYNRYREWVRTSKSSGEEQRRGGHAPLQQCRLNVLCEIDQESGRLRRYQQVRASLETMGTPPEVVRHSVSDAPTLDGLLRYEAALDRSFDRTLNRLERLQRMRLGQPVLPKLEVSHSMS